MNLEVKASPTKHFFVDMLTRDIALKDAILDLIDNCLDGILRHAKPKRGVGDLERYAGHSVSLTINRRGFEIVDDCGGISRKIATETAFMLGRVPERVERLPTVGVYGIGMKRAIFKLGEDATVHSHPVGEAAYKVHISPKWLSDDTAWTLQLEDAPSELEHPGTRITVKKLKPEIARAFDDGNSPFVEELRNEIAHTYALIIQRGFAIAVNGRRVEPVGTTLRISPKAASKGAKIAPFVVTARIKNVDVTVMVGFYRALATEAELEVVDGGPVQSRSSDHAGVTIVCNDRVVLYKDKTVLTGWGTGAVPRYHNQFIAITGIVTFQSDTPEALPLNSTKRGVDLGTDVYQFALDQLKDGLKRFTDFTNKWKQRERETTADFKETKAASPAEVIKSIPAGSWSQPRRHKQEKLRKFVPVLPAPVGESSRVRIAFTRDLSEVELVRSFYFDDDQVGASEVGERCFEDSLSKARK